MGRYKPKREKQRFYYSIIIGFIVLYGLLSLVRLLEKSLFFNHKERINLIFYSANPRFYSLGLIDKVNYQLSFFPDLTLTVPGGYGDYRVGALGKLIKLEKKANILQKISSYNLGNFTDFYFYKPSGQIFYGQGRAIKDIPLVREVFTLKTNASFFDRLYLGLFFIKNNQAKFIELATPESYKKSDKEILFNRDYFYKSHLGFFYKKSYRNENKDIQIIYTKSYQTAKAISEIFEGEGIRVVDYTKNNQDETKERCLVVENEKKASQTARTIANFFNCSLKFGKTNVSDIIVYLNKLEVEWEVDK